MSRNVVIFGGAGEVGKVLSTTLLRMASDFGEPIDNLYIVGTNPEKSEAFVRGLRVSCFGVNNKFGKIISATTNQFKDMVESGGAADIDLVILSVASQQERRLFATPDLSVDELRTGVNIANSALVRESLLPTIKSIIKTNGGKHVPHPNLMVLTSPIDAMCGLLAEELSKEHFDIRRILGFGSLLDSARLIVALEETLKIDQSQISGNPYVISIHGGKMVPAVKDLFVTVDDKRYTLETYADKFMPGRPFNDILAELQTRVSREGGSIVRMQRGQVDNTATGRLAARTALAFLTGGRSEEKYNERVPMLGSVYNPAAGVSYGQRVKPSLVEGRVSVVPASRQPHLYESQQQTFKAAINQIKAMMNEVGVTIPDQRRNLIG